jgi:hypothetical protein
MKKFDLCAYGVMEMNHQEMVSKNGGWVIGPILGAILGGMIYQFIDDTEGCINAFKEGREAGKEAAH